MESKRASLRKLLRDFELRFSRKCVCHSGSSKESMLDDSASSALEMSAAPISSFASLSPPVHFESSRPETMSAVDWPPAQTEEQVAAVLSLASDWALSHGLVLRPVAAASSPPSTTSAIHAPCTLYPSPFPRKLFDQARGLQEIYNSLYASVTVDKEFLEDVVGGAVALVDEFQGRLYEIWRTVEAEGVKQVSKVL